MPKIRWAVLASAMAVLASAAAGLPADPRPKPKDPALKMGSVLISPHYTLAGTYDDNINSVSDGGGAKKSTVIISQNAGFGLQTTGSKKHRLTGGYDFSAENYQSQPSANNNIGHKLDAAYQYRGSNVRTEVVESYVMSDSPYRDASQSVLASDTFSRQRHWTNAAGAAAEYAFSNKTFLGVGVQDTVDRYREPSVAADLDQSETALSLKGGFNVDRKTRVYAKVQRVLLHYSAGRPDNHKDWLALAGAEGLLAPKLTGRLESGLQYLKFDPSAGQDVPSSQKAWQSSADLLYKITPKTHANLRVMRSLNVSSTDQAGGRSFINEGAVLFVNSDMFRRRVTLGATGGLQIDAYPGDVTIDGTTARRRDVVYYGKLDVGYRITKLLSVGVGYQYTRRESNFARAFGFRRNQVGGTVTVAL